ncbi:MAG: FAD-dependent oxidoreductase [Planctomycetes bacterium]|nr:FAD-dependent oxidoreductase [Planctomycetota bacterium]
MTNLKHILLHASLLLPFSHLFAADTVLVEAESFEKHGGWVLDTQFIDNMGSPYLLAHGMGRPLPDATTEVKFPSTGEYHVFVRTKDWVARWDAPGQPGKFNLLIDGEPLAETFGTKGKEWFWHDGGVVNVEKESATLALHDLTGFDGRCDAILFTKDNSPPPNAGEILPAWRRDLLGLADKPTEKKGYDLVVVGGGYSGMGSAISAARMGCKVALIQNRPVLGGNGSSEVRVWAMGLIRRGEYPRIGEIIEEFADKATKSPGRADEFGDDLKEQVVRAEKNIDLFLNHHAYKVDRDINRITSVCAFDTRTSEHKKFSGKMFVDCTGHGTIGYLAKADWEMEPKGRMGMSNMWVWSEGDEPVDFPKTPWALDLEMKDFPYPRDHHGQWFWESGFDKDPLGGAETIRDWNLRAVYGAFNAMKNRDGRADHRNARLAWIAFIGGPRESRRLMGDVILTQKDVVDKRKFPDGCVPSTWSIDLHYPKKQYAEKFPDNPFISIAEHDRRVDRTYGYPIPYRCFYSRSIENLFMAGRNISVTHQALGTTRVMKTCGMMGEVVGKAASICTLHDCMPREVYTHYLDDLKQLLHLPGQARRETVIDKIQMPEKLLPASAAGPPTGIDPKSLPGIVMDDVDAIKSGEWTSGAGLKGYVGYGYLYASPQSKSMIKFAPVVTKAGTYEVRLGYGHHENRGKTVSVTVDAGGAQKAHRINMSEPAPLEHGFISLGTVTLKANEFCRVTVSSEGAGGFAHADSVQLLPVKE